MFYKKEKDRHIQLDQGKRNGFLAQRRRGLDYVCHCIAGDEAVVYEQLYEHVDWILPDSQSGFRHNDGPVLQSVRIVHI